MSERTIGAIERLGAIRIDIRECPMGPMPGFALTIPRCVVNIRIPDALLDEAELLEIAREMKARVLGFGKHYCAMAFHFWFPEQKAGQEEAIAIVDYAPGGKWEDALNSPIGDYGKHMFKVICNRTGGIE